MRCLGAVFVCLMLVGCVGFFFGPGYASDDPAYFAAPPVVVEKGGRFVLRWRYGRMGFFFQPRYAVREGALRFSLQGTSSSGSLRNRETEMPIEGTKALAALRASGAYWWETNGRLTPLEILHEPAEWPLSVDVDLQVSP